MNAVDEKEKIDMILTWHYKSPNNNIRIIYQRGVGQGNKYLDSLTKHLRLSPGNLKKKKFSLEG